MKEHKSLVLTRWQKKRHGIIENLEVDQYLEAQGYTEYDNTINMEI